MPFPRVPPVLVGALSDFAECLESHGNERGVPAEQVASLLAVIPEALLAAPCFLDRLTGLWRYDFGAPIDRLPADRVVLGTLMFTPVGRLLDVLVVAQSRLAHDELVEYAQRLADPGRHQDVMAEMLPVLALGTEVQLDFEVPGEGGRTVDWLIHRFAEPDILLDVKNRIFDLVDYFTTIVDSGTEGEAPAPRHDHSRILRDIEEKFTPSDPTVRLQGAWIVSQLQQEEGELRDAFADLDPSRVHFVIVNNWTREAYILTGENVDGPQVLSALGLTHSDRFVFRLQDEG